MGSGEYGGRVGTAGKPSSVNSEGAWSRQLLQAASVSVVLQWFLQAGKRWHVGWGAVFKARSQGCPFLCLFRG